MAKKLSEELTLLRRRKGLTQTELAKRVGLSTATIGFYEQGRMKPSPKNLLKLAQALDVDPNYLLSLLDDEKQVAKRSGTLPQIEAFTMGKNGQLVKTSVSEFVTLPVLGQVHAGDPNFIPDKEIIDVIKLPRRIAHSADYALLIKGMSMVEEGINEGDIVLVKAQSDADNNQIVIARVGEEYTIKRLKKENGRIWLEPANSHFGYRKINPPFEIVGRIVYLLKKFS